MIRVLGDKQRALELASVVDAADLRSNDKFANLLRSLDVDPPMKRSPSTGLETYAFAKTDSAFIDLAEHEDPRVQALVAARLGHKSTLEETRTQRLLSIADLQWPVGKYWMPIPLGYGRAHTHRFGGDMKLNMQNLPRKSALRRALAAPTGYTVVSIDLSQIEARIVAWLCGQLDLLEAFAMGEDVYSTFAGMVFATEVSRKVRPDLRFIGKTAILGLGYGMSWQKFQLSLKSGSKKETGTAIELRDEMCRRVVNTYRAQYSDINAGWTTLDSTAMMTLSRGGLFVFGPCEFRQQEAVLPRSGEQAFGVRQPGTVDVQVRRHPQAHLWGQDPGEHDAIAGPHHHHRYGSSRSECARSSFCPSGPR
jgi:DNA polymerase